MIRTDYDHMNGNDVQAFDMEKVATMVSRMTFGTLRMICALCRQPTHNPEFIADIIEVVKRHYRYDIDD